MSAARSLVWTRRALRDLELIGEYIAIDKPAAAEKWLSKLLAAAERAARNPRGGRRVPEIDRDEIREVFQRTYRIVYRVKATRIEVLTVFEGQRRFPTDAVSD